MTPHNFTLADVRACATAFALFPLYVVLPGYVAAWLLDLFSFRHRTLPFRIALSIPLSISLCPIVVYLTGRFAGMTAVTWLFGAVWVAFGAILVRGGLGPAHKGFGIIPVLTGIWVA